MPTYRLTIDAHRNPPAGYDGPAEESRTFVKYVKAVTPAVARQSIGNRPVTDVTDGAWFDEWRITAARKAPVFEVVTTDTAAWHSNGITGINVHYSKRVANAQLRTFREKCKPGQGAFLRTVTE
jgi:hypothetical protein